MVTAVELAVASSLPATSNADYKLICSVGEVAAIVRRTENLATAGI
jgi:hypothetical protein